MICNVASAERAAGFQDEEEKKKNMLNLSPNAASMLLHKDGLPLRPDTDDSRSLSRSRSRSRHRSSKHYSIRQVIDYMKNKFSKVDDNAISMGENIDSLQNAVNALSTDFSTLNNNLKTLSNNFNDLKDLIRTSFNKTAESNATRSPQQIQTNGGNSTIFKIIESNTDADLQSLQKTWTSKEKWTTVSRNNKTKTKTLINKANNNNFISRKSVKSSVVSDNNRFAVLMDTDSFPEVTAHKANSNANPFESNSTKNIAAKASVSNSATSNKNSDHIPNLSSSDVVNKYKAVPIIAYDLGHKELRENLIANNHNFKILRRGNDDKSVIVPADRNAHDFTLNFLKTKNTKFYTFTNKEDRVSTLIIKGIPKDFTVEDILTEFENRSLADKIHKVSLLKSTNLSTFNFFLLQIKPGVSLDQFLKIKFFLNIEVKIDKFVRSEPTQCFICQSTGHVSNRCNMDPVCVKCAGPHLSKDCEIKESVPRNQLKCALCQQNGHPANYKGCPVMKEIIAARNKDKRKNPHSPIVTSKIKNGMSFASALKDDAGTGQFDFSTQVENSFIEAAAMECFGHNLSHVKSLYRDFMRCYNEADSLPMKRQILMNFLHATNYE